MRTIKAGPIEVPPPTKITKSIAEIDSIMTPLISRDYAACAARSISAAHRLRNFYLTEWCQDIWRGEGLVWDIGPQSVFVRWDASPGEFWALAYDVPGGYRVISSDPDPSECSVVGCKKHCLGGFWEALSRYVCHDMGADTVRPLGIDLW